jgi:hypothetical protein
MNANILSASCTLTPFPRVTGNAVAMGEAAGATAAVAAKNKSAPHDVPWSEVQLVIEKVRNQGRNNRSQRTHARSVHPLG